MLLPKRHLNSWNRQYECVGLLPRPSVQVLLQFQSCGRYQKNQVRRPTIAVRLRERHRVTQGQPIRQHLQAVRSHVLLPTLHAMKLHQGARRVMCRCDHQ